MKTAVTICLLAAAPLFSQTLDFSSLDKLAAKAKEVNKISLTKDQLKNALSLFSASDKETAKDMTQVRSLVEKLTSVEVRNFEFAHKGAYKDSDVEPIRAQLGRLPNWSKIVDSKQEHEHSEIFVCTEDGKTQGLAIIAAEENELSVVLLKGSPNLSDLGGLGGVMGIPSMQLGPAAKSGVTAK